MFGQGHCVRQLTAWAMLPRGRNFGRTTQKVQNFEAELILEGFPRFKAETGPSFLSTFSFPIPQRKKALK
jgi:hypothetical protein